MFVGRTCYKDNYHVIDFCSKEYPIFGGFDGEGYQRLANDLCREAITNGFNLIRNGSYKYGNKYGRGTIVAGSKGTAYIDRGGYKLFDQIHAIQGIQSIF